MTLENTQEKNFVVPSIIAEGTAFEFISSLKKRNELFEEVMKYLNIKNKYNTYLKYFLHSTDPKKGGIPQNQNFAVICEAMENALTVMLLRIFQRTEGERVEAVVKWWGIRNSKKAIMDRINEILEPYSQNLKNLKAIENETLQNFSIG